MNIVNIVTNLLSYLTLFSDMAIVVFLFSFLIMYRSKKQNAFFKNKLVLWFKQKGFLFAFIVAVVATLGSLFYSEVAQYEPCKLCWFQRIFMYPQVVLLGLFLDRKDKVAIIRPVIVLSIIGAVIALYHYYLQLSPAGAFVPCSTVGISVSCTTREFTNLGYITIPMMAFSAFILIIAFLWLHAKVGVKKKK